MAKDINYFEFSWQTADNIKIYAQGWQPAGEIKGVVCLVHGIGEHSSRYAPLARTLNKAGYAMLGFDMRGHGKSEGVRGDVPSYESYLNDIDHFLEEAKLCYPNKPFFLYGHSLGGNLVINFVLRRHPHINGVIATAPALRIPPPPPFKMFLARTMRNIWPSFKQKTDLDMNLGSRTPAAVKYYKTDPLSHGLISVRMFFGFYEAGLWALEYASEFPLPLLLMHGSADGITVPVASEEFASKIKSGCTFKLWPGLYHNLHDEPEKEEVFKFIISWLNKK